MTVWVCSITNKTHITVMNILCIIKGLSGINVLERPQKTDTEDIKWLIAS